MKMKSPEFKKQLYQQLPVVYRNRDNGDLEKYLEACGGFLDRIYETIAARMADNFPDTPIDNPEVSIDAPVCQDWVLPYFAKLLDVRLCSPVADGKRGEISNAVSWRKKKGTLSVIEEIAKSVGQMEVEVQEGWKRVAITPVIGRPLLPVDTFGYDGEPDEGCPAMCALHPALPAVTVDFRSPSGATGVDATNSGVNYTTVNGELKTWRQASVHGVPCSPGSFDDVSRRIVDLRIFETKKGYFHPGRLLLFTPPSTGFFPEDAVGLNWTSMGSNIFEQYIETDIDEENKIITYRNRTYGQSDFRQVRIYRVIELGEIYPGPFAERYTYRFIGLHLDNSVIVHSGRVEFLKCAVRKIEVHSIDRNIPVISARSTLFKHIAAARGLVFLEYCTVIEKCLSEVIQASDSVFLDDIHKDHDNPAPPDVGCVRYSYVSGSQAGKEGDVFSGPLYDGPVVMFTTTFGDPGCAVLMPESSGKITRGAEEGGEIGAYHDDYLSARYDAVIEKMKDYLPLNLETEIITDANLLDIPSGS